MYVASLEPWHIWLIVGALLLTAEVFVPGFVLAGLGLSGFVAAGAHYLSDNLGWALAAYSVSALVFFVGIRPVALRTFMSDEPSPFGVNAMLGNRVTITDSPDVGGGLQAEFRDTRWSIESEDSLMEGDRAEIIGVKSNTLVVKRIDSRDRVEN